MLQIEHGLSGLKRGQFRVPLCSTSISSSKLMMSCVESNSTPLQEERLSEGGNYFKWWLGA